MRTIQIKQASGAVRVIAVSDADAAAVRNDPAMIDAVAVLGAVDVFRDGRQEWGQTGPRHRDIPADVRAALATVTR